MSLTLETKEKQKGAEQVQDKGPGEETEGGHRGEEHQLWVCQAPQGMRVQMRQVRVLRGQTGHIKCPCWV